MEISRLHTGIYYSIWEINPGIPEYGKDNTKIFYNNFILKPK